MNQTNKFLNNLAPYGPDIGSVGVGFLSMTSPPSKIRPINLYWESLYSTSPTLRMAQMTQTTSVANAISGGANTFGPYFAVVDLYGQIYILWDSTILTLEVGNYSRNTSDVYTDSFGFSSAFLSSTTFKAASGTGVFTIPPIQINYWPNSNLSAKFSLQLNPLPQDIVTNYPGLSTFVTPNLQIAVQFRDCGMGEQYQDGGICKNCSEGFYVINLDYPTKQACLPCESEVAFCYGGPMLAPKPAEKERHCELGHKVSKCRLLQRQWWKRLELQSDWYLFRKQYRKFVWPMSWRFRECSS